MSPQIKIFSRDSLLQPLCKHISDPKTNAFEVKDSLTVLLIIFVIAVLFATLICYYPGKAYLKGNFWPLFALPALLASGCLFKILSSRIILRVDAIGLRFFRSGIIVSWQDLQSAILTEEDEGDGEIATFLKIKYSDPVQNQLFETNFLISGSMNKTASEIIEAIAVFQQQFSTSS